MHDYTLCACSMCGRVMHSIALIIFIIAKYWPFGIFPAKKKPGKCLRRFPFVLRHCERDGQLPIHPRSSVTCTPVSLLVLVHVCPLGVAGLGVARCGYSRMPHLIIMHNIYSSVRLLRLDNKCSAERQQLQYCCM